MKKIPTFSVIMPTFNRASALERAIDSVLCQSFTDWELIIVDDGSTDDTKRIVANYNDSRIIYFWQENKERSAARNKGINIAIGAWICFLDSDDSIMPHHLQSFYNGMLYSPGYDMYRTGFVIMNQEKKIGQSGLTPISHFYNTYPNDFMVIYTFRKVIFNDQRFDDRFNYMEDMHFLLRVTSRFSYLQLPHHTYIYNYDPYVTRRLSRNFKSIIFNTNQCIDDMLLFDANPVRKFLIWTKIVNILLYLRGCIIFEKKEMVNGLYLNLITFLKYPLLYIKVVLRICFVKIKELLGYKILNFRF